MSDPRVIQELASQMLQLTEGVTSTLARKVKDALLESLRGSEAIGTLQERIAAELPALTAELERVFGSNEARALNIARTETGRAANGSRFATYADAGIKETQWISSHDDAVRESHRQLDGEVRALGTEFKHGLRFPHDPNGTASEVCSCRCTLLAILPS
jgi:SPP1 gp7 family putative phage head morphogenesis protein